jgi:hypothetical protein
MHPIQAAPMDDIDRHWDKIIGDRVRLPHLTPMLT